MKYKYTLSIDGMMCGHCEAHVNNIVNKNFKVKKVKSSASKNQTVIISLEELDEEVLRQKINETGYLVTGLVKEEI